MVNASVVMALSLVSFSIFRLLFLERDTVRPLFFSAILQLFFRTIDPAVGNSVTAEQPVLYEVMLSQVVRMVAWASGWGPEEPEAATGAPACSTSGSGSTHTEGPTEPSPDLPPLCLEGQTSEYRPHHCQRHRYLSTEYWKHLHHVLTRNILPSRVFV